MTGGGFVRLENLVKRFDSVTAVDRVSVSIQRGEILALLGPSGSGKTTTLRLLAGFEAPDEGTVVVDGKDVTRLQPVARRVGMVFQHYALFPHLDVGGNVAFGIEPKRLRGSEVERRVGEALALVDLQGYQRRRVGQLSGGEQQRVALARALAPEPQVLLLDEPLSNLDPSLRERTRREIRDLIHRVGITTVLVTHEQDEAFELGDRVAVLRDGRLEQTGTPDDLYEAPVNPFVAGFVGRSSTITVQVVGPSPRGVRVLIGDIEWDVEVAPGGPPRAPGQVLMLVRPEALRLTTPNPGTLQATVSGRRFLGPSALFSARMDGGGVIEVMAPPAAAQVGERVGIMPSRRAGGGIHLFAVGGP